MPIRVAPVTASNTNIISTPPHATHSASDPGPDALAAASRLGDPHIIGALLAHADRGILLALRSTCSALRERADALLFHHVVVSGTSSAAVHAPHGLRLPGIDWADASASDSARQRFAAALRMHTRVLDCRTKLDIASVDSALADALSNVQVVRRFGPETPALPARTLVDFAFLTPNPEEAHAQADSSIASPCACPSTFTYHVPAGTATSVTNVFYDPVRYPIHSFLDLGDCSENTHSVIIYTARAESRRNSQAESAASNPNTNTASKSRSNSYNNTNVGRSRSIRNISRSNSYFSVRSSFSHPSSSNRHDWSVSADDPLSEVLLQSPPLAPCGSDEIPPLGMLSHLVEELAMRIGEFIAATSAVPPTPTTATFATFQRDTLFPSPFAIPTPPMTPTASAMGGAPAIASVTMTPTPSSAIPLATPPALFDLHSPSPSGPPRRAPTHMAGRHTLVGIDEIPHALLALPEHATEAEIRVAIREAVHEEACVLFPPDVADQVPAALEFVSRSDYAARIGHAAYALESRW